MGADSEIAWTNHTFNPWWGCTKVSPGCDNCYAETFAKRVGQRVWGADAPRRFFGDKHWNEPLKWNAAAAKAGVRARVFCASMADVFEGRPEDQPHRLRLWALIRATPHLDWLLLTKRPGAILPLLHGDIAAIAEVAFTQVDLEALTWLRSWTNGRPPANVWMGTTVENQASAYVRVDRLREVPAALRFLSVEPLLEHVTLGLDGIDWVIVGGESGPGARPFDIAWARDIVAQCKRAGVACFVKQLGARPQMSSSMSRSSSGTTRDGSKFSFRVVEASFEGDLALKDRKGGDMSEWPADLRVREFPEVRHG